MLCTLCGLPAKLTHNYCQACGNELPIRSARPEREPAVESVMPELVVAPEVPSASALGTRWLSFWTYFALPVHAFFSLLFGLPLFVLATGLTQALGFHYVALGALSVGVSIGLELRRRWAWQLNRLLVYLLCGEAVLMGASLEIAAAKASGQPVDAAAFATAALVMLILCAVGGLLWVWPNHVYWRKREALFQTSGGVLSATAGDRMRFGGVLGLWFLGRRLPATCTGVVLVSLGLTFAAIGVRSLERLEQLETSAISAHNQSR